MPRYIKRFASTMPASQEGQVNVLLQEGTEDGSVKNFAEFKTALEAYATQLQMKPKPLHQLILARSYGLIDSWTFNYLMRMAQLDIETVFTEVDNMYKKTDIYRRLSRKFIQDIRDSVASLDTKIGREELLRAQGDYALCQYNTFNTLGVGRLYRDAQEAGTLFLDYRKGDTLPASYDCVVDAQREGLVLPINTIRQAEITSVLVDTEHSTESHLDVDPADNDLAYLLEKDDGLYWVHNILVLSTDYYGNTHQPDSAGATVRLVLELSGYQDINTLTLVPFTDSATVISQIQYEDVDGNTYSITTDDITISEESTITFNRVRAGAIILDITQKSYAELIDFTYSSQPATIQDINEVVEGAQLSGLSIGQGQGTEYAKGYFYTTGFDYIGAALCEYNERGIYVTTPLNSAGRISEVFLDASYQKSEDQQGNVNDAVEFSIFKYDYDATDGLLGISRLPLPGDTADTTHEELVIVGDTGVLRFYPRTSTLYVYRDKAPLTLGTDYTLSNDGVNFFSSLAQLDANAAAGPPYQLYVRLLYPVSSSVYTVSYSIAIADPDNSASPLYLNSERTASLEDGVIEFTYPPGYEIAYSKIFLVILMRSLTYVNRETPIVLEYGLFASEV